MKKAALIASLFLLLGCSGRASLTPEKALLGHWEVEQEGTAYYFSPDKMTLVEKGKERREFQYFTIPTGESGKLRLRIGPRQSLIHEKVLVYDGERCRATVDTMFGIEKPNEQPGGLNAPLSQEVWRYIDSKQTP